MSLSVMLECGVDVLSSRILLRTSNLDRSHRFYRDLPGLVRDSPQLHHSSTW